jgi:hypothetical protein
MWGPLRIILLIANAAYFAGWGYVVTMARPTSAEWWTYPIAYGLGACLAFNIAFLWMGKDGHSRFRLSDWRIFRLIGLWFDAKESELRRRAGQDK